MSTPERDGANSAPRDPAAAMVPSDQPAANQPAANQPAPTQLVPQPAPTRWGPNYGLVGYALLLVCGAGAVLWQLAGLPHVDLSRIGPEVLVVGGLGLVVVGQMGLLRRRRLARRRARATDRSP